VIAQRHRIRRQVLEVHAPEEVASEIQNELSRIQRQHLELIIDECCSELSSPDRIHRIDKLEVDLGHVSLQSFETQLRQALKSALRKALQSRIEILDREARTSDQHPAAKSQLELVVYFASTGTLPWWADSNHSRHLRDSIEFLLEHAPDDLAVLLRELARHPRQLQRILLNCEDATLITLFKVLSSPEPVSSQIGQQLLAIVRSHLFQLGRGSTSARTLFWAAVLATAMRPVSSAAMERSSASITSVFWRRVFMQLAKDSPDLYRTIAGAIIRLVRGSESGLFNEMKAGLLEAVSQVENHYPGNLPREVALELARLLRAADASPDTSEFSSHVVVRHQAYASEKRDMRDSQSFAQAMDENRREQVRKKRNDERTNGLELAFADADSVYVENSGLVILWIFLEPFFGRVNLLKNKSFKDTAARHRAARLLQYMATEDTSPPEYQMTLNKLICGIDPEEILEFGPPVTEMEAEESANLISAVIENAPILRNMSHSGFRGSFLLRKGMLSAGEASWILRVERETFDLVLDRFPWSFSWIKLPWMEIPLGVEW
jgi:hypothetical protein